MSQSLELRIREITTQPLESTPIGYAEIRERVGQRLNQSNRHVVLYGDPGSGKSHVIQSVATNPNRSKSAYQLDLQSILPAIVSGERVLPILQAFETSTRQLAPAIIVIEDLDQLGLDDPLRAEIATQLLQVLIREPLNTLLISINRITAESAFGRSAIFNRSFDLIGLPILSDDEAIEIVQSTLAAKNTVTVQPEAIREAVRIGRRYGNRALPDSAFLLLNEASFQNPGATIALPDVQTVAAKQTGVPLAQLTTNEREKLASFESRLTSRVVGQPQVLRTIAGTIQRARLNLTDPHRPRGSFLLLGPSGVGKTETAKAVSQLLFSPTQPMVRLDMSEYVDAHTAARLTGPPPGYVGYDAGGQLTNPIIQRPYSLILLDELEKSHQRLHDVFLQVLDDGRLTDSRGTLVDFSQTVLFATSNVAASAIANNVQQGKDVQNPAFFDTVILPELLKYFRPEFINRFDSVLIYEPLSSAALLAVAHFGIKRLADRLADRNIQFALPDALLATWIAPYQNPLLGARPVLRVLRDRLETPIARYLVEHPDTQNITVTGEESWLN